MLLVEAWRQPVKKINNLFSCFYSKNLEKKKPRNYREFDSFSNLLKQPIRDAKKIFTGVVLYGNRELRKPPSNFKLVLDIAKCFFMLQFKLLFFWWVPLLSGSLCCAEDMEGSRRRRMKESLSGIGEDEIGVWWQREKKKLTAEKSRHSECSSEIGKESQWAFGDKLINVIYLQNAF